MVDAEKITLAPESPRSTREVFICDPSAEADRLQANLRARGYPVVDVPLGLLSSRIRYEQPDVIVLDADAPDAASILRDTLDASHGELQFVLLGETTDQLTALALLFPNKTLAFSRPVDVDQVALSVANLLGPPLQTPQRSRAPRPPVLMAASRRPVRVDSVSIPPAKSADSRPVTEVPPALTPSLPPLSTPSGPPTLGVRSRPPLSSNRQTERAFGLSAETRAILEQGRRKIRLTDAEPARPYRLGSSADAEVETGSPFLDALGAPLETDEDAPSFPPELHDSTGTEPRLEGPSDGVSGPAHVVEAPLIDMHAFGELDEFELEESTNPGGKRLREHMRQAAFAPTSSSASFDDLPPSSRDPTGVVFEVPPSIPLHQAGSARTPESEPPITIAERKAASASAPPVEPPRRTLARAIAARASVVLVQQAARGLRRLVLRDGDLVSVTSSSDLESLVRYLEGQGRLTQPTAEKLRNIPAPPRQAGAALVAAGALAHEELLPTLTAYSKWLATRILQTPEPILTEADPAQRLLDEPDVFGGRAGAEVYLGILNAAVQPEQAFHDLGRGALSLGPGAQKQIIAEAGLDPTALYRIWSADDLVQLNRTDKGRLVQLAGLVELGALQTGVPLEVPENQAILHVAPEPKLNIRAFDEQLEARLRLSRSGDYFRILGLDWHATSYEIERARKAIQNDFARERIPASQAHRLADIEELLAMVDEAYRVLIQDERRKRYQRALERQKRVSSG